MLTTQLQPSIALPATRARGAGLVRRIYGPRVVGLGLGALAVGAGLWQNDAPGVLWAALIFNGLIWPHIAHYWALHSAAPYAAEHRNLLLDSFGGGFWVPAMSFNLLPSVLILTMLSMDNIGVGGWRLFVKGLLAHAAGAALALALLGYRLEPASSLATIGACIPFLVTYPIVIGVVTYRLSLQLSRQKNELQRMNERDGLSGLYSRSYWQSRLEQEFHRARRSGRPVSLLSIDLDHFKRINDGHGHAAGDMAIRHLGRLLITELRQTDIAGRLGGEEFAILLTDTTAAKATRLAERLRVALRNARVPIGAGVQLTFSGGIAQLAESDSSHLQWLQRADRALYQAKNAGRDTLRVDGGSPSTRA
jgi:diguanylate cyclase